MITTAADGFKEVRPPLSDADIESLKAGDRVRITGVLYTARDAAHGRLLPADGAGQPLPIDVKGQIIYYTGPSPARPGHVVGSIGPTTGGRMDKFTPKLLALGLKGTIGKGVRSQPVKDALREHKAVYFGAIGGAGAVLSRLREEARGRRLRRPRHRGHPPARGGRLPGHGHQRLPRRRSLPGRHEAVREGLDTCSRRSFQNQRGEVIPGATLRTDAWWLEPPSGSCSGRLHRVLDVGGVAERPLLRRPVPVALLFAVHLEVVPARDVRSRPARHQPPDHRHRLAGLSDPVGPGPASALTCYYYRKAYYRSFWLAPAACAVRDAHGSYSGETRFPLILQNLHRYCLVRGSRSSSCFLTWDAILAFRFPNGRVGMGVGTIVMDQRDPVPPTRFPATPAVTSAAAP